LTVSIGNKTIALYIDARLSGDVTHLSSFKKELQVQRFRTTVYRLFKYSISTWKSKIHIEYRTFV